MSNRTIISKVSDITKPGYYQDEFGNKFTIDTEYNRNDDLVYILIVNWKFVKKGYRNKTWKTLEGVKRYISMQIAYKDEDWKLFTIEPDV